MFLVEHFGVGGRLQYINCNTHAGSPGGDPRALISVMRVGEAQSVEAEMGHIVARLGCWVIAAAGQDADGSQWIVVIQQGPKTSGGALKFVRNQAVNMSAGVIVTDELLVSRRRVNKYYREGIRRDAGPHPTTATVLDLNFVSDVQFHVLLQGFVAELTGYPTSKIVSQCPYKCAHPDREHDCTGELITDIFTEWYRQGPK